MNILGNKDLINAKLETVEEPHILVTKSSKSSLEVGISTKTLFQSILPSFEYGLSLESKNKICDSRDAAINEIDDDANMDAIMNAPSIDFPMMDWVASSADVVRPKITGYRMSNTPCEYVW